ncbi:alpha/beta hydrolase [Arenimonas composti]|nr:alpha/beta fold hydrolase [Arenimonas composti]
MRMLPPLIRTLGLVAPAVAADFARRVATRPSPARRRPEPAGAEPVTFRFGLAGLRWGAGGPTVLALHGWEGRAAQFRGLGERLAARGYRLVALDAPAHGRSPGREADPVVFADALREAAAELGPLHAVVGHSMGGASVLYAVSQGLRSERSVAIAAPAGVGGVLARIAGRLGLGETARRRFFAAMSQRSGMPPEALDIDRLAGGIGQPLLVVHDHEDAVIPFADAERIAGATRARLLATRGLGHRNVLRDPAVLDQIVDFLDARAA